MTAVSSLALLVMAEFSGLFHGADYENLVVDEVQRGDREEGGGGGGGGVDIYGVRVQIVEGEAKRGRKKKEMKRERDGGRGCEEGGIEKIK